MKAGDLVRIIGAEEIMLVVDTFQTSPDMAYTTVGMALCLRGGNVQYIPKDMLEAINESR